MDEWIVALIMSYLLLGLLLADMTIIKTDDWEYYFMLFFWLPILLVLIVAAILLILISLFIPKGDRNA